jgi:hypothetical protein
MGKKNKSFDPIESPGHTDLMVAPEAISTHAMDPMPDPPEPLPFDEPAAPAVAFQAPAAPIVDNVITGRGARDPLVGHDGPTMLPLRTWAAAKRFRDVDIAGFASWARSNTPAECTAPEWAAHFARYKTIPIT